MAFTVLSATQIQPAPAQLPPPPQAAGTEAIARGQQYDPTADARRFRQTFALPSTDAAIAAAALAPDSASIATWGVPLLPTEFSQLQERVRLSRESVALDRLLAENESLTAGVYLDHHQNGEFVVGILATAPESLKDAIRAAIPAGAHLRFNSVKRSTSDLNRVTQQLTEQVLTAERARKSGQTVPASNTVAALDALGIRMTSIGPDLTTNLVSVGLTPFESTHADSVAAVWDNLVLGGNAPARSSIRFEKSGEVRTTETRSFSYGQMKAGLSLTGTGGGCTSNLGVRDSFGRNMLLLAGHCFTSGTDVYHAFIRIGSKSTSTFTTGSNADAGIVNLAPRGGLASPYAMAVFSCGGGGALCPPRIDPISSYRATANIHVNDAVCFGGSGSAVTNVTRCTTVKATNQSVTASGVTTVNQVSVNLDTYQGDSGGLWGFSSEAFGIHSATNGTTSFFSPIGNALAALGLTLYTTVSSVPATYSPLGVAHSGKCVDLPGGGAYNGAPIVQYSCNGFGNQNWSYVPVPNGQVGPSGTPAYEIKYWPSPSKCLDVVNVSQANNARIQLWDCIGGSNEKWWLDANTPGEFRIISINSGKCVDVLGFSSADQTPLQQYDCLDSANQGWSIR